MRPSRKVIASAANAAPVRIFICRETPCSVEKNMKIHEISTKNHPKIDVKIDITCIKKTSFRKRLNVLKPYDSCSRIGVPEDSPIHTAINIQRKSDTKSMPEKGMQKDAKMRENGAQMGAKIH